MSIAENLNQIKNTLLPTVDLVAVSKTKPSSFIEEAYAAGQRIFGENRPQEMKSKAEELPKAMDQNQQAIQCSLDDPEDCEMCGS